ncbi:unconventional myosin-Ic-A-like isoform X2 [Halichondria panicea]|uniref:unconventional myosin-Ic-A-like isoform X2 n=1 Tax=Halichondria panicea TaxID=6063 RepID=UPI00312BA722
MSRCPVQGSSSFLCELSSTTDTDTRPGQELSSSLIRQNNCFYLDTSNFKVKEQFPLSDISAISVSSLSDGVVVIGLPTEGPNARGDLIIKTEQVIELVTKLALFGGKLDTVKIVSTGTSPPHCPHLHQAGDI